MSANVWLLQHLHLVAALIAWGICLGILIAWNAGRRVFILVRLARAIEGAQGNWKRVAFMRVVRSTYEIGGILIAGAALAYPPYWILGLASPSPTRQAISATYWIVFAAVLLPMLLSLPRRRRWKREYMASNSVRCARCGKANDRPHFPGHHNHFVVCGFAAKMVDGGYVCRWCNAPLCFPEVKLVRPPETE